MMLQSQNDIILSWILKGDIDLVEKVWLTRGQQRSGSDDSFDMFAKLSWPNQHILQKYDYIGSFCKDLATLLPSSWEG